MFKARLFVQQGGTKIMSLINPPKSIGRKNKNKSTPSGNVALTFSVALFGVIVGVLGSLGFIGSYLHTQFNNENLAFSHQIAALKTNMSFRPAAYTAATDGTCSIPSSSVVTPTSVVVPPKVLPSAVLTAAVTPTTSTSKTSTVYPFVQKLTTGVFTTTGTISDTGPQSTNQVTTNNTATTTVTNNNNISVQSSNPQTSKSGSSSVVNNTNAGSSTTGSASNTSDTSFDFKIQN
jgi:hypothetical protein